MPPVLMVHGVTDKRVQFEKYAQPLLRVLGARGGEVETNFVPGEGHVFSEAAMKLVRSKAANFFLPEAVFSQAQRVEIAFLGQCRH